MYQLALGEFKKEKQGCHDHSIVKEVDPFSGMVRIEFSTSASHCRINNDYNQKYFKNHPLPVVDNLRGLKGNYIYDNLLIDFKCEVSYGQLICLDVNPDKMSEICEDYQEFFAHKYPEENISNIMIREGSIFSANLISCVRDTREYTAFHQEEIVYSTTTIPMPMSDVELKQNEDLNDQYVYLYMFIKRAGPIKDFKVRTAN